MLLSEIWKQIPGYEGIYDASSFGRIRSYYVQHSGNPGKKADLATVPQHICGLSINKSVNHSSFVVRLTIGNEQKTKDVAVLVCSTFNGCRPSLRHQVCHSNNNSLDNNINNLRWDLPLGNMWDKPFKITAQAILEFYNLIFVKQLSVKDACRISCIDRHSCCGLLAIIRSGLLTIDQVLALREPSETKRVISSVIPEITSP